MQHPAWLLIFAGLTLTAVGALWLLLPAVPWLGRLPGDLAVERENFHFYFPIVTCLLLSLLASGVLWLVRHLTR